MRKVSFILTVVFVAFLAASCDYQPVIAKVEIQMVKVAPEKGEAFFIGKYEVTQKEWRAVMGTKPADNLSGDDYPVENVSYDEVLKFIAKLNEKTNAGYRLPTRQEWETAAYAANRQFYKYSGTTDDLDSYAWYKNNSQDVHNEAQTHPVGTKKPNALGLYDMSGNVSEMTSDIAINSEYVYTKGGTCKSVPSNCEITAQDSILNYGGVRGIRCGFRLARSVK